MKGVIIIAFNNFRDEEFFIPYNYFKEQNIDITVASTELGIATGTYGKQFEIDKKISDLKVMDFDFIFFVGGSGSTTIRNDKNAISLAISFYEKEKIVAAICLAPTILAKANLLKDKKATVWKGIDGELNKDTYTILKEAEAIPVDESVVVSQRIVTGRDYLSSMELAKKIVQLCT